MQVTESCLWILFSHTQLPTLTESQDSPCAVFFFLLRDCSPELPIAQDLKIVVSHMLPCDMVAYSGRDALPWLHNVQKLH